MVPQTSATPVAVVTGAAKGIGRAVALRLARDGYDLVASDVDLDGVEGTAHDVEGLGRTAAAVVCDVRNKDDVERMIAEAERRFGRIDAAVNNAGLGTRATSVVDLTEEDWDLVVDTDLKGVWFSMKFELPAMLRSGGGAIVNVASVLGLVGFDDISPAYVAAKHGVVGLTRAAAQQYATQGIRVNAVCPGPIDTPGVAARLARQPGTREDMEVWQPMCRLGTPEEVADAIAWLCSRSSSYVTGTTLAVDGGYTSA